MKPNLVLVRHCAATGQHPEAPLSDLGRGQADDLASVLQSLDLQIEHIVSSPFLRALQTIEPFAQRSDLSIRRDDRLRERKLSGVDLEDWLDHLERSWRDFDYCAPGGETSREGQTRGREALDAIAAESGGTALLVSHGNLLTLLLNSIDASFGSDAWEAMTNPDIFLLEPRTDGYSIERIWDAD